MRQWRIDRHRKGRDHTREVLREQRETLSPEAVAVIKALAERLEATDARVDELVRVLAGKGEA